MLKQIDGAYIAAQIRMSRQVEKGAIIIVEGETDERVLRKFINKPTCNIEIAYGKDNLLEALDYLEDEGFDGVIALKDADFDRVLAVSHSLESLVLTDLHDLDLTIFCSPALEYYILEHCDNELFAARFSSDFERLRVAIVGAAMPIGACRMASEQQDLRLYFKDLQFSDFVSEIDLSLDIDKLIQMLIDRSSTTATAEFLKRFITNVTKLDIFQVACGHDVAALLGIALRKMLGRRNITQTWASEIEAGLRLAFDMESFKKTNIYGSFRDWEAANPKYKLLLV